MLMRLRGRVALRLVMPFLRGRYALATEAVEKGHRPLSYDPDWWVGQQMVLIHLLDDMRNGRICTSPFTVPSTTKKEDDRG